MNLREAIADHYGPATAQSYDRIAKTLIWAYSETLEAVAVEALYGRRQERDLLPRIRSVLDLGIGTGNLSLKLAEELEAARPAGEAGRVRWVGFDGSPHMTGVARAKLEPKAWLDLGIAHGDLKDPAALPSGEEFDCVISSFAIHHLDPEGKRSLFERLYDRVAPGGIIVIADKMTPPFNDAEDYHAVIAAKCLRALRADYPGLKLTTLMEDLQRSFDADGDQPSSVTEHLQWLREAGFAEARCPFSSFGCSVVSARKPIEPPRRH